MLRWIYIHAYEHPLLAALLNPAHADFSNPRLWEAKGRVTKRDGQLKCGCRSLTTVREVDLPKVTTIQRVAFGIYCALEVYSKPTFVKWANKWLRGEDRTEKAARAARAEWAAESAAAGEVVSAAAWAAAWEAKTLNLIKLAEKAMEVK